jgi:hypothetical protein
MKQFRVTYARVPGSYEVRVVMAADRESAKHELAVVLGTAEVVIISIVDA